MPEIYKAEYESHLKNCPECQAKIERLKYLRSMLNDNPVALDNKFLDKSFERLQVKMGYVKNTGKSFETRASVYKYVVPVVAAAAVAVFALVLPLNLLGSNKTSSASVAKTTASVAPIVTAIPSADNVSLSSGRTKVISGNIQEPVLPTATNSIKITVPSVNNMPVQVQIEFPNNEAVTMGKY
ncbi:MAG: hypothetical protein IKX23_05900 [Treponema sp.]|nr:hypothetical protein [Treponema sp.]